MATKKATLHDNRWRLAVHKDSYGEPVSEFRTIERSQVGYYAVQVDINW